MCIFCTVKFFYSDVQLCMLWSWLKVPLVSFIYVVSSFECSVPESAHGKT